jgi:hypothetical protein
MATTSKEISGQRRMRRRLAARDAQSVMHASAQGVQRKGAKKPEARRSGKHGPLRAVRPFRGRWGKAGCVVR